MLGCCWCLLYMHHVTKARDVFPFQEFLREFLRKLKEVIDLTIREDISAASYLIPSFNKCHPKSTQQSQNGFFGGSP